MVLQKTTLKNGLRVLTYEMPEMISVTANIFIKTGSRNETKKESGIAHFIEHILFRGTKKYPTNKDLSGAIESVGGLQNAWTGIENTDFWVKIPYHYLPLALEILNQLLFHPLLLPKEIEKEKKVIIQEINMANDDPSRFVFDLLIETMWPDSPLGHRIGGKKETVSRFTRSMILNFMEKWYQPKNMVLSVAGKIKHKDVIKLAEKFFKTPEVKKAEISQVEPSFKAKTNIKNRFQKTDQTHLALGFYSFSRKDKERTAQSILATILGGSMTSRLFTEVREKRGLAYEIHSGILKLQDIGALVIYAGLNNEKVFEALKIIFNELKKLKNQKISVKELQRTKDFIKGNLALDLESTSKVSSWFGEQELLDPKTLSYKQMVKKIDTVTTSEIQKVANQIFQKQNTQLTFIGPFKNKEKFAKILKHQKI